MIGNLITIVTIFATFLSPCAHGQYAILQFPRNDPELLKFSDISPKGNGYEVWINKMVGFDQVSFVLESMSLSSCDRNNASHPRLIVDNGQHFENRTEICHESITYYNGGFNKPTFILITNNHTRIYKAGVWGSNDKAVIVASNLMYDYDDCSQCLERGRFCCENMEDTCNSNANVKVNNSGLIIPKKTTVNCLPWNMVCDGHPNCGTQCNMDETLETCDPNAFKKFAHPFFKLDYMKFSDILPLQKGYEIEITASLYHYSIVLEQMTAHSCDRNDNDRPKLIVQSGVNFEVEQEICYEFLEFSHGKFNNNQTTFVLTSNSALRIVKAGKWTPNDSAQIVATAIFQEDNCSQCPTNFFCCDQQVGTCGKADISFKTIQNQVSCIPTDVLCDGHPNCGMLCSSSEADLCDDGIEELNHPFFHEKTLKFAENSKPSGYEIVIDMDSNYGFSIVLESMSAKSCDAPDHPYILVETGKNYEEKYFLCFATLQYDKGAFSQQTFIFTTGNGPLYHTKILKRGIWGPNDQAQLVVNRNLVVSSCSECNKDIYFCCSQGIPTSEGFEPTEASVICIPNEMKCNGHPNCGNQPSADETGATCDPSGAKSLNSVGWNLFPLILVVIYNYFDFNLCIEM